MVSTPPTNRAPVAGIWGQLVELWSGRNLPPPPPPEPGPIPVVEHPLSAPPYPTPTPAVSTRYQSEWTAVTLSTATPTAQYKTQTRPDFYALYLLTPATAGDVVWVALSQNPPAAPILAAGVPQNVPACLAGPNTVYLHAAEQFLGLTFAGTGPVTVIIVACANIPPPRT